MAFDWDRVFRCPECGDECFHLGPVEVTQGPRGYQIGREGASAYDRIRYSERGSTISFTLIGECGHAYVASVAFHKGRTSMTLARSKGIETAAAAGGDGGVSVPGELWRD